MQHVGRHQALLVIDVVLEFVAEVLDEALHRQRRGIAQRADRASGDVVRHRHQQVEVLVPALAVLDPVHHPPEPARPFAARRALAAGLLVIEIRQPQQRFHHAARVVHQDHGARTQHRSGLGDRVVIHVGLHHHVTRQHRHRGATRDACLELAAAAHAAGHFEQRGERRAEADFVVAGTRDVAGNREDLGAAVVRPAEIEEGFAAVVDDPRHGGERLGVVDRRRLAVEAEARRERRLEPRLALLAFERFEERGFLAADVGAVAVVIVQVKTEFGALDVGAEEAGLVRFGDRVLHALVGLPDLAVDVVVAAAAAHRVRGDRHALDQRVRVVPHDVAILERAGLAFVGVADEILVALVLLRHEAPLEARRKARAAAAAQRRPLHFADHRCRRDLLGENLLERRVAAARDVVREPPVGSRQPGHDDGVGAVVQEFAGRVHLIPTRALGGPATRRSARRACRHPSSCTCACCRRAAPARRRRRPCTRLPSA